jgi:translocation and assembly module TamA
LLHEVTESTTSDSFRLAGLQTRAHDDWTETRFIELLHERSEIGSDITESTLLMAGLGLRRTHADDILRTRRGYRLSLELRAAHDALLSSTSLLQLQGSAKGIYRFGDAGRITGRAQLGATLGGEFFDLPASLRFFAGGDNSVRGYAYKSLSPLDENGEAIGGRHLITTSLEYEHPVAGEDWWGAAFVDAGNAFDTDDFELKYGYGVGLRWYSPVGRVRLDLAFPNDTSDGSVQLHFSLGADL